MKTTKKTNENQKVNENVEGWKFVTSDGKTFIGNREEIARELNIFDDVYDDDVWDKYVDMLRLEWIE